MNQNSEGTWLESGVESLASGFQAITIAGSGDLGRLILYDPYGPYVCISRITLVKSFCSRC